MARLSLIIFSVCLAASPVHLIVPPKTPVLSGFEPAAIGTYRELVCDASQPDAGTITYKWYKYVPKDSQGNTWESIGPIVTGQKYIFNPVSERQVFYHGGDAVHVSGKYKCRASNSAGTRDSNWGDLYVYTPCSMYTVSVSPAKPAIGSTFTLKCFIPNPSGLTVYWRRKTDTSSSSMNVAVANSKRGCHAPPYTRYSWSSCSSPSPSSRTFNIQVTNAQSSDFAYWICQDIGLSCISDPVKPVVQAPPGTPQIEGFPTGPVSAGDQVNLKCVASPPGDTYDWYKDSTKQTTSLTYDFKVKKESAGVYKCVARNTAGSATSSNKTLSVYSKSDSVDVSSVKTSCHAGETDSFTCTATGGSPPPNLKIYIKRSGGSPVEVTQGQDRVMTKADNQAGYYCEAKVAGYPSFDMTSTRKTYNVTFPNTKISFINNLTASVQDGQVKKLTCETDESYPVASIMWYLHIMGGLWKNFTTGSTSSERNGACEGKIRISEWPVKATKDMNGGTVRCTSSYSLPGHGLFVHSADTVMSVKWSATELKMVMMPNSPIIVGTSVNIKCETDSSNSGYPGTISWYRNGQQITTGVTPSTRPATDGGTIYISQLTVTTRKEDNQAKYECKINDQANFKKDVTITVYFPQSGIHLSETNITVREGESKTITCSTSSSSNPVVSGVSVKKRLGSTDSEVDVTGTSRVTDGTNYGKDVSMDIKLDTNRKDNGALYICSFTYGSTSLTKTATVNVQFNPSKITMIQKPNTAIHEGQLITIVCETDSANPAADIQFHRKRPGENWMKQTSLVTSEDMNAQYNGMIRKSTLKVTANRTDNQAVFRCKVNDRTFQVDQATTVIVHYPPTVKLSSNPKPVKEGENLTLTCEASGGNPTSNTYIWYYNNRKQSETSREFIKTGIKYTQSGKYKCEAVNYSPGGKAEDMTEVDVQYKAKWNPALPELFTVASKTNEPVKFVLHVITEPPPTTVTWFYQNGTKIGESFKALKVNAITYTLNKTSVTIKDYGNYTVNVTNQVGVSTFVFELQRAGPPYPPCCLKMVNSTAVSVYLTFKSNFSGGSTQTFTIEQSPEGSRRKRSEWVKAAVKIPDPGFEKDVFHKVKGLTNETMYHFRVKAVNADGSSGYNDPGNGNILKVTTKAAPVADLVVSLKDDTVTVLWSLDRVYSKIRIEYCPVKRVSPCSYRFFKSPAKQGSTQFDVNKEYYKYSLVVFDGDDKVFVSAHKVPPPPPPLPNSGVIGGGAAGGVLLILVIVAVILTVVFIKKKRAKKGENKHLTVTFDNTSREEGSGGGPGSGPVYMNIDNNGFKAEVVNVEPVYVNDFSEPHTVVNYQPEAEPEYDELQYEQRVQEIVYEDVTPRPSAQTAPKSIDDITVEEFKQWLLSKKVTESTYKVLAKNGLNQAAIFVLLQRDEDIKGLHIKPLGQEIVVRNLAKSFNMLNEGKWSQEAGASSGDGSTRDDMENPYAELNIKPDVIADQVYTDLRPSKK